MTVDRANLRDACLGVHGNPKFVFPARNVTLILSFHMNGIDETRGRIIGDGLTGKN